ncbi:MAG: hypothetical protein R3D62_10055 [Xanthobacteraceae bacterium]
MLNLLAAVTVALGCAACNATSSTTPGPLPAAASGGGPVVAFESIDGPPESIYGKLVHSLSEEANARQLAVVFRGAPADYRVRVYAATIVYSKRSVLHWVWDVYNASQRRAFRIAGEELMAGAGRTTWASADDRMIRRIARAGMDRLARYLRSQETAPAPIPPPGAASAIAIAAAH